MTISLKNIEIFEEKHGFPGCGFFEFFENLDFWTFDHCILYSFLRGFSLWQRGIDSTKQMMVYDQITFFIKFSFFVFDLFWDFFLRMQKTLGNIPKSAEYANLPRIPIKNVEGHAAELVPVGFSGCDL